MAPRRETTTVTAVVLGTLLLLLPRPATALSSRPNFVFLLAESTDGRLFRPDSPVPLPNIRALQASGGVLFDSTYANAPVCCPSRSSFLSGRYPHKLNHTHNGVDVRGVWNNYEGLPVNYNATLFDLLRDAGGYALHLGGKTDWTVGGHSESCFLEAFTHNVPFPFNVSADGGWNQEGGVCASCTTQRECVSPGGTGGPAGSTYPGDWDGVQAGAAFIAQSAASGVPFMAYQGFNIMHPPYATNDYWWDAVTGNVTLPTWLPYDEMHPCDFQASMLKGCTPGEGNATAFDDPTRVRRVRRVYYAEVAEFDAMVGRYVAAVRAAGVQNDTVFIVTADHGDLQLEHRQFYKMHFYEGSAHVPLLIAWPGLPPATVTQPTQLLDLLPTVLELAGLAGSIPPYADGYSLAPFLLHGQDKDGGRPDWVLSQFHGDDIAMSWFMLVQGGYKYVAWGLGPGAAYPGHPGAVVNPQLFNLQDDPDELTDLWSPASPLAADMDATLRAAIDYPSVALDVAQYQLDMFAWWRGANAGTWEGQLADPSRVRWADAWAADPAGCLAAVHAWMGSPAQLQPCRNGTGG